MQTDQQIIAVLYAAGEQGVSLTTLSEVLQLDAAALRQHLQRLQDQTAHNDSPLIIKQYGASFKLLTKPQYQAVIERYLQKDQASHLSQAAVEVLAIIAYQQPITRVEIDAIRGVKNSNATIQTLQARQLIKDKGRKEAPGRPIMYITTEEFLDYFGLKTLADLPDLKNFANGELQQPINLELFSEKGKVKNGD
ncbi:SMC-Scp complex subunit ScpB [Bombilactobacillus bombi]|uniref:SMC-Scp complex subunit ScpB n=1 Tax=Bombilactobacillus bombi TaxID=1303590 RepID=UPI0015E5AA39|nr:SMC-Scp complex subunit ScpB [Bombilactobacillus bombi]MBA1435077.1 SMC-Scp complex subunit ScpB [Bombilactobacillus bombi]